MSATKPRHSPHRAVPSFRGAAGALAASVMVVGTLLTGGAFAQNTPPSTSSVTILGLFSVGPASISNVNGASQARLQNSLNFPNYLAIRGTEDLGNGNAASFSLATNLNVPMGTSGQGAAFWNKNSWVGLSNRDWGAIAIGRNDEFGGEQCFTGVLCASGLIFNLHPGNLDRIGGGQLANMVKYISPELGAYRFRGYYAFADRSTGSHAGRAVGLEAVYRGQSLAVTATYESINGTTVSPANGSTGIGLTRFFGAAAAPATAFVMDKQDIYTLGARYAVGDFIFYGLLSDVALTYKGAKESLKSYESGLTYNITQPLALTGACYHSTFATSAWNTCGITLNYTLSKRTSIFLADSAERTSGPSQKAQMFQASGPSSTQTQNAIAAGIRHSF